MTFSNRCKTQDPLAHVARAYDALRRGQVVPFRSELDPRAIDPALPYAFVAERIAPGLVRLRVAGQHLTDLMGMEVRGMPLSALFAPEHRTALGAAVEEVFATPARAEFGLSATASGGPLMRGAPVGGRMMLWPLRNDMGDVARILGCVVTDAQPRATPQRLSIEWTETLPLAAMPGPAPVSYPEAVSATHSAPGLHEGTPAFRDAAPSDRAPYLRIVKAE